jgi:glucokinase
MKKTELAIGIDIGGTKTVYGFVDEKGNFLASGKLNTTDFQIPDKFVSTLANILKEIILKLSNDFSIHGIGIGAPNGNYYKGTIEFAPNMPWKGIVPLAKMFHDALGIPALLTNDANAAALGEMVYGAAKGMKDFIIITLGTGLGSGIVVNGQLVYGHDGFAGEIGHSIIFPDGRDCGCGRKGCLETYCSAKGITRTVNEILSTSESSSTLRSYFNTGIDSKVIYEAAVAGDEVALKAFEYTGNILGLALANSVVYTSPEAIFLFGGLSNAGGYIFNPTIKSFEANLLKIYQGKVKILPSGLKESDAAVLGAASLVWEMKN